MKIQLNRRTWGAWLLGAAAAMALPLASWAGAYEDFFRAVERGDDYAVRGLLERGFDPNSVDAQGHPALYMAMRDESEALARLLLSHPSIKPDLANAHNETPLMMAALRGRLDLAEALLQKGAQVKREGWTPLHYAASGPEPKMLSLLLDRGAPLEAPSPNRTTPLMMAAGYGAQDGAVLLLSRGADPRPRNDAGFSAADFARRAGRDALAQRLDQAAQQQPPR